MPVLDRSNKAMPDVQTRKTTGESKFTQCWIRAQGFSLAFTQLKPLSELSASERLLAAFLANDYQSVETVLLQESLPTVIPELMLIVQTEGLGALILDRIVEWQVADLLDPQLLESEQIRTFISVISKFSRTQTGSQMNLEGRFASLLELIGEEQLEHMLWTKGIHLSRTIYGRPELRPVGDIDVIVHPAAMNSFLRTLEKAGFRPFEGPEFCNQTGVGPTSQSDDSFLTPVPELIPASALSLGRPDYPMIDVKIGPLDRGVQVVELDRFFASAENGSCRGFRYRAPAKSDHLMIMLRNLDKDRFVNWKTLLDVHLLAQRLSSADWRNFVAACMTESIGHSAWLGLSVAADRLKTNIPDFVLDQLSPSASGFAGRYLSFTISPAFVWNTTSLPMLLLNANVSDDRQRKLKLLRKAMFPPTEFLKRYYAKNAGELTAAGYAKLILLHWLVLLLPGGVVRRTFGRLVWPKSRSN